MERFNAHFNLCKARIPASQLLVLDVTADKGWAPLCEFLELPIPVHS